MNDRLAQIMRRASNVVNRVVAQRWGEAFPFYYAVEYPKSGGTWLARMMADALQIPRPDRSIFPIGCSSVLHSHWNYMPRLRRVVYIHRDGRDIMVSALFHRLRAMSDDNAVVARAARADLERAFGPGFDAGDVPGLLPAFVDDMFRRPWGVRMTWVEHIEQWMPPGGRPHVVITSYERLRASPVEELSRIMAEVTGAEMDAWRIESAVERQSMHRQTGRAPGEENRGHFIRKGIVGDWRNHFTPEAARRFDALAGDTLVRLGYETDRSWVEHVDGPGARSPAPVH